MISSLHRLRDNTLSGSSGHIVLVHGDSIMVHNSLWLWKLVAIHTSTDYNSIIISSSRLTNNSMNRYCQTLHASVSYLQTGTTPVIQPVPNTDLHGLDTKSSATTKDTSTIDGQNCIHGSPLQAFLTLTKQALTYRSKEINTSNISTAKTSLHTVVVDDLANLLIAHPTDEILSGFMQLVSFDRENDSNNNSILSPLIILIDQKTVGKQIFMSLSVCVLLFFCWFTCHRFNFLVSYYCYIIFFSSLFLLFHRLSLVSLFVLMEMILQH